MWPTLWIVIGELALLALVGVIVLLLSNRRKKNRRLRELEDLVDRIHESEALRMDKLSLSVSHHRPLDKPATQQLVHELLAAEKQFLHDFIALQMLESVDGFYEKLCGLLDHYIRLLGDTAAAAPEETEQHSVTQPLEEETPAAEEPIGAPESPTAAEPAPDWGDVFD
jgi:hypothetical protein